MDENKQEIEEYIQSVQQETSNDTPAQKPSAKAIRGNVFAWGVVTGLLIALCITGSMYIYNAYKAEQIQQASTEQTQEAEQSVVNVAVEKKLKLLEDSIDKYYLNDVTTEDLETGVYKGVIEALGDPYSAYYTPQELETLREKTSGIYYGIGAYIGIDADTQYCKIVSVIENTPAEEAGLKAEDLLVEVEGQSTKGMTTTDVVALIKGEENTDVLLKIFRTGESDYLDFTVTRREVESPTVNYEMLEDGMAYIQIVQFEAVTTDQFIEKMTQAREDGMKGLILDLRNNPGGTLTSVVEIAREMLPEGMIVYTEDKAGKRDEYKCDGKKQLEVPLVVLVNENSASAAEILSGAVKDYGIGTLLGTTTFGKGIVQKVFGITDGSAVKLTISHYYTPNGADIHGVGIEPDETLEFDSEAYVNDGTDNQLERAKEILGGK